MVTGNSWTVVSNDQQRSFYNKIYILSNVNTPKARFLQGKVCLFYHNLQSWVLLIICMLDKRQVIFQLKDKLKSKIKSRK